MNGFNNVSRQSKSYYKMDHAKRGFAVIFHHDKVSSLGDLARAGSSADCRQLKNTLRNLQFEVEVEHNLDFDGIVKKLKRVKQRIDAENDCIVIAILTFGKNGRLYSNDHSYDLDKITEHFTATECPALATKPKIFIVQACEVNSKNTKRDLTETDSMNHLIPNHADFLITYSTIPGSLAWSDKQNHGSWFIRSLCIELDVNSRSYDLLTLLTIVKQRVDHEYEKFLKLPSNESLVRSDVPCTTSMLTRTLKFDEKPGKNQRNQD